MIRLMLAALALMQNPPQDSRLPVPGRTEERNARRTVQNLFKAEYRSRDPVKLATLAETLFDQAVKDGQDPAVRYVLFREAETVSGKARAFSSALTAVDALIETFAVDPIETKRDAIAKLMKLRPGPEEIKEIANDYMRLAEKAIAADRYDDALDLLQETGRIARRVRQTDVALKAASRAKEVAALKKEHDRLEKAKKTLAKDPSDEQANLEVGLHLCFAGQDWPQGLKHLKKSGGDYADLARMELLGALTTQAMVGLGEAWWNQAKRERDKELKVGCQRRSHTWLRAAMEKSNGLEALALKKRVGEMEEEAPHLLEAGTPLAAGATPEGGSPLILPKGSPNLLHDMFRQVYDKKLKNPAYLRSKSSGSVNRTYQAFPEEAHLKQIRSRISAAVSPPPGAKAVSIALRQGRPPKIDGMMRRGEWFGASSVKLPGAETTLFLTATATKLYVACDVPGEKTESAYGQFFFHFHINISPHLVDEYIILGKATPPNHLFLGRRTNVKWKGPPPTSPQEKWKTYPITDGAIYKAAKGATKLNPHRQYEVELDLKETGFHAGVPFSAFVQVTTEPTLVDKKRRTTYLGKLGSQGGPVWFVIGSERPRPKKALQQTNKGDKVGTLYNSFEALVSDQKEKGYSLMGRFGKSWPAKVTKVETAMNMITVQRPEGGSLRYGGAGHELKVIRLKSGSGEENVVVFKSLEKKEP